MPCLFRGPPHKVREIEALLRILDARELPEQFSDRKPYYLPLKHADANEVAGMLRDVFAVEMGLHNNRGTQSRDGSRTSQSSPMLIEMTLGVDEQTNQLIVSTNDSLYKRVEAVVTTLDEAARVANKTVHVVPVQNANSAVIQQTLSSLFPKVTVTTTDNRSSQNGKSSSSGRDKDRDKNRDRGSSENDDFRRFL